MNITYFGHSCLFVESGGKKVIIDPFLSGNPASGVSPNEIEADAVLLTHAHDDHFGDSIEIAKRNDCPIVAVFELAMHCVRLGARAHAMNIGGAYDFDGFRVKYTQAFHGSSLREGDTYHYAGQPAGILLTMDGKTIYHAGDTSLFGDMKLIGEMNDIALAALPIGDNFTMGPEDAVHAARWLRAKRVVPLHYDTFPVIRQDTGKFAAMLGEHDIACFPLKSKETISI
ncbi:metal-dependent hydrolase [Paenibacillus sp. GYB003]|uniref:metal-dependent hydrolase n=1 Tax=Paenibacillus sp. GYB003 TaxID=2994392 RepID=UPI002F9659CC